MADSRPVPALCSDADYATEAAEHASAAAPALAPVLLNAEAAAALLDISRRHFQQLDRSGRLGPQPVKLGRCTRWSRNALERWAAAGCPCRPDWQAMEAHD